MVHMSLYSQTIQFTLSPMVHCVIAPFWQHLVIMDPAPIKKPLLMVMPLWDSNGAWLPPQIYVTVDILHP